MRKCLVSIVAAATLGIVAFQASAEERPIGKHSVQEVSDACKKAGGDFDWSANTGAYGCRKENCDGKGGACTVTCSPEKNCYGSTPGRAAPPVRRFDLIKILKVSPKGPPHTGLLEPSPGSSPNGPSGLGTSKPSAPTPILQ